MLLSHVKRKNVFTYIETQIKQMRHNVIENVYIKQLIFHVQILQHE